MWNYWVGIKNFSTFSSSEKKKKKGKKDKKSILRMIALFPVLGARDNRLMILVWPSMKDSSMPQAAQMTSGKTLPFLWALILSFLLVQRGFARLNVLKILNGSAYSHGSQTKSQRQRVLVINFSSQIAKRPWHCGSKSSTSTTVRA